MNLDCEAARSRFSDLLDGALPDGERDALRAHLSACSRCREDFREWERTAAIVRAVPEESPSSGFADRVMDSVREERARSQRKRFLRISVAAAGSIAAGILLVVLIRPPEFEGGIEDRSLQVADAPEKRESAKLGVPAAESALAPAEEEVRLAEEKADEKALEDFVSGAKGAPRAKTAFRTSNLPQPVPAEDLDFLKGEWSARSDDRQKPDSPQARDEEESRLDSDRVAAKPLPESTHYFFAKAAEAESLRGLLGTLEPPAPTAPAAPARENAETELGAAQGLTSEGQAAGRRSRSQPLVHTPSGARVLRLTVSEAKLEELRRSWKGIPGLDLQEIPTSMLESTEKKNPPKDVANERLSKEKRAAGEIRLVEIVILLYEPQPQKGK